MNYRLGWRPDVPDIRDYIPETFAKDDRLKCVGLHENESLPKFVDLRQWCPPIQDQKSLGSCTAQAGCGMYEYFERKSFGKFIPHSRLFLYKVTRNLMKETGDNGAMLRTTMQAMATFGVCPEEYWLYDLSKFDVEPSQFCYAFAQNFQALKYFRLDAPNNTRADVLHRVKEYLSRGYAVMFGFSVYDSIQRMVNGVIPFPSRHDLLQGGHAVCSVGYDDDKDALLIRNSWGTSWGDGGYGWLPYQYVLSDLADDFWSMTSAEFLDSGQFS
jgi:C1A family cysteine protease